MPQNTVLPQWRADYPILAPAQKPGGVTVLTTATAPRVPNKPSYAAGTIQAMSELQSVVEGDGTVVEEPVEDAEVEEEVVDEAEEIEHDENGHPKPRRSHHRKKSRR